MAFAKAEALTMVCMKNRFWTLIAKQMPTLDAVGGKPTASVVSGVFSPSIFTSQTRDVNAGFRATGGSRTLVKHN